MATENENKPTPDPTILTTEQLLREIENATRLTDAKIEGAAVEFQAKVVGAQQFCTERFASIETQLNLIERQRVEQKVDTTTAVDAALAAAKEAVSKTEEITKTQLRQLSDNFIASLKGLADNLADVKDRVVKIEARRLGAEETITTKRLDAGLVVGALGLLVAVMAVAAAVIIGAR